MSSPREQVDSPLSNQSRYDQKLKTKWLGKSMEHYAKIDSTQRLALKRAEEGVEDGYVIIADQQTKGRGRREKTWYSNNTDGLWFSIVLRPKISPSKAQHLTFLAAIVMTEAVEAITQIKPMIKWPNDLLINDKKVAGILTEMKAERNQVKYVVIGIGLNINQEASDFDLNIRERATSLKVELNQIFQKRRLIEEILTRFETHYQTYLKNGFDPVKKKWLQSAYRLGQMLDYTIDGVKKRGDFVGIDDEGALLVKDEQNQLQALYSAEIKWF